MVLITVERVIDTPIAKSWELLSDYQNIHKLHPMVSSVDLHSPQPRGEGAVRTCKLHDGNHLTEKVTAWDEAARSFSIVITEASVPVKTADVKLTAREEEGERTKLIAEMDIVPKYGVLGWILTFFMKPQFGRGLGGFFAGIEHFAKTGEEVSNEFVPATPALVK